MTAQVSDSILVDDIRCKLFVLPLEVLFEAMPDRPYFKPPHTANWRGYVASWKIEDGRLWLIGLNGQLESKRDICEPRRREDPAGQLRRIVARIESLPEGPGGVRQSDLCWYGSRIPDENGLADRELASKITVRQLLCSYLIPVSASWYTGLLRVPLGEELDYVHGGFHSEYEMDLIIEIEAGSVRRRWMIDNRPGRKARQCEAEIVEKSILVFKPVFGLADESAYKAAIEKPLETIFLGWERQKEDLSRFVQPRLAAIYRAQMENTYRNRAILSSFPVKSAGLGEAIGYFLWRHFAKRASHAEMMSQEDQEARTAYANAVAAFDEARVAIGMTIWLREEIANREPALAKMHFVKLSLAAFAAAASRMRPQIGFEYNYGHCEKASELLSKLDVPPSDDELAEWAIEKIRSAERLIADEKFELLGVADGLVHEYAGTLAGDHDLDDDFEEETEF